MDTLLAPIVRFGDSQVSSTELHELFADGEAKRPNGVKDIRVAPLLISVDATSSKRVIGVGHCLIMQTITDEVLVNVTLVDSWVLEETISDMTSRIQAPVINSFRHVNGSGEVKDTEFVCSEISKAILASVLPQLETRSDHEVPKVAKILCEMSRNTISKVRDLRYNFETMLAKSSHGTSGSEAYTQIVAHLLQLNVICGRAADQAREAHREGLWLFIVDSPAYHSYRKLQDPSIVNDAIPANTAMRPWMRIHDAAIRQCIQLQLQLENESTAIQALISSATSISSSREADAQTRFNLLVALLSIGLGVPALFLALYSATTILPLDSMPKIWVFLPVGLALLASATLAIVKAPNGHTKNLWQICGVVTFVVCAAMIGAAIWFPLQNP
ncbi:hypothetical protein [Arthrobacter sp. UCD-GKA]|uniref:hypothetical protein n=1 Tax=Arthrobacter sp. UCD-GKA TaxID=1913576 RepID=UPI001113E7F5|nr:hypothetical protein [Arthrobacter sp. UCD-GKA]